MKASPFFILIAAAIVGPFQALAAMLLDRQVTDSDLIGYAAEGG